jgi:tRNA A-37 threonylcarbamoyl transferase component Bud32
MPFLRDTLQMGRLTSICNPSLVSELKKVYCEHDWVYDFVSKQSDTRVLRGRHPVLLATIANSDCVVKRHFHGGFLAKITRDCLMSPSRVLNAMLAADYLIDKGILTPVYQFVSWRTSVVCTRAESGVKFIPDGTDAADYLFGQTDDTSLESIQIVSKKIGEVVRRLHNANFIHCDLNLMNLLVTKTGHIYVLDLDKSSRPQAQVTHRQCRANLARLFRSVRKIGLQHSLELVNLVLDGIEKGYGSN